MTGAEFILAINLCVAGLLAAAFLSVAAYDRRHESARWFALSYVVGMSNFLFEFAIASLGTSIVLVLAAYASFLAALTVFNVGVARKYSVPAPWVTMAIVFIAAVATCYFIRDMSRQSFMRMLLYQSPYFIMQAIAVGIVAKAKTRSALDNVLMGLLAASALQFLSKPFLFRAFGGTGDSPDQYLTTKYALFSQSMGTIFAMAVALMLLVILVRDEAAQRLDMDPGVLASRERLEAVARRNPRSREELEEVEELRAWQREVLGDGFLHALLQLRK